MKLKTLLIAIAILAVLSGASALLNRGARSPGESDARINRPLVDPSVIEKSAGLRLSENGKTVLLKKSGSFWVVASYHDLPADFDKLARFAQDLATTKVARLVTDNPKRMESLEFKDTRIALLDSSDHTLAEITLGKTAEAGGGRFLRFGNEPKAYLAPLNAWLDPESRNWADAALTHFSTADIAKVTVELPGSSAPLSLSRAKNDASFAADAIPPGKQLNQASINSLIGTLAGLRFTETTALDDPKAGAARSHFRTVTLVSFTGKTITIRIGREPERTIVTDVSPAPTSVVEPLVATTAQPDAGPAKILGAPLTKTIPAGPVFAHVATSDSGDPVNLAMQKRAFQIGDSALNSLPATPDALFEPLPAEKPAPAKP